MTINDASFWVFVGFVILFLFAGRGTWRSITAALDTRSKEISEKIRDASRMREEALALLNTCKRQHIESREHAAGILAHAEEEASRLRQKALKEAEEFLQVEERLFQERLRQAEERALEEIREKAILVAGDAVREILQNKASDPSKEAETQQELQAFCDKIDTQPLSNEAA